MANDFFAKPFQDAGIEIFLPSDADQALIHQKIVDELENGIVKADTKQKLLTIIRQLTKEKQLDGVVLGCTELPLILRQSDFDDIQVFDISQIQMTAAVDRLLK